MSELTDRDKQVIDMQMLRGPSREDDDIRAAAERVMNADTFWTGEMAVGPGTWTGSPDDAVRVAAAYLIITEILADFGKADLIIDDDDFDSVAETEEVEAAIDNHVKTYEAVRELAKKLASTSSGQR
jgi:hypothetical protein